MSRAVTMNLNYNRSRVNMLNFGHFMSLQEARRRSNLNYSLAGVSAAFFKGLAMTKKTPFCPRERLP